jgi:hypothetical protein
MLIEPGCLRPKRQLINPVTLTDSSFVASLNTDKPTGAGQSMEVIRPGRALKPMGVRISGIALNA